ncbi:hypothetical protein ZWY2020_054433 [Hordeum vulgare]|nr:hypothetical protein ZWY2020_054433 [Hordeum vulgare]
MATLTSLTSNANPNKSFEVLCSAWKDDGTTVFSGGCDKQVKMWPLLSGGQAQTVAMHDAPVKEVAWISQMNLLVSGSWDKTLRYWDTRQANPAHNPQTEFKRIQSPLKYQTRCVAAFPDQQGFLVGSIEGRVGVHHIDDSQQSKNFTFKCHRKEMTFSLSIRSTFTLFITRLPQLDLMVLSTSGIRIASRDLRLLVVVLNPFLAVASIMMAQYLLMGCAMTGAVVREP